MNRHTWIIGAVVGVHAVVAASVFSGCQSIYKKPGTASSVRGEIPRPLPPPAETVTPRPVPSPRPVISPPATPEATEPFAEPTTTYTVVPGDTLSGIAARFSLNQRDIVALNNLADPDKVRVGQKLKLPGKLDLKAAPSAPSRRAPSAARPVEGDVYVVKKGDTLSELALRFDVTAEALRKANNLRGDLIRIGQKLTIPSAATGNPGESRREPRGPSSAMPEPVRKAGGETSEIPVREGDIPPISDPAPPAVEETSGGPVSVDETGQRYREVVVQEGEDLVSLSMKWNVSPVKIRKINNLDSRKIVAGQKLRIPESSIASGE